MLAGRWLGVPVFLTIRDGSIVDAAPMCLHHGDRMPADCGVRKLWRECSEEYFVQYLAGRRSRLRSKLAFLYFWLDSRLKQRFLRRVDGVIGVSRGILDIYRRSGLLEGVRSTHVIHNVPPPTAPAPAADVEASRERLGLRGRQVVLYVGKFSPGKGSADLVAAADGIARQCPEVFRDKNLRGRYLETSQLAASYTHYLDTLNGQRRLDEIRRFHSLDYGAKRERILALMDSGRN